MGAAIGEVMSRLALRRNALQLQVVTVLVTVGGLLLVETVRLQGPGPLVAGGGIHLVPLIVPGLVASVVAVIKLR